MTYRTTRQADADLIELYRQGVERFGMAQAEGYLADLLDTLATLATQPRMARERTEFSPPVRIHPHRSHLVIFRAEAEGILVIRVPHRRQNWERLLA